MCVYGHGCPRCHDGYCEIEDAARVEELSREHEAKQDAALFDAHVESLFLAWLESIDHRDLDDSTELAAHAAH